MSNNNSNYSIGNLTQENILHMRTKVNLHRASEGRPLLNADDVAGIVSAFEQLANNEAINRELHNNLEENEQRAEAQEIERLLEKGKKRYNEKYNDKARFSASGDSRYGNLLEKAKDKEFGEYAVRKTIEHQIFNNK